MHAEGEGEFGFHLHAYKQIMPYFFAAGHFNYTRFGLCYITFTEKLPNETLESIMKGGQGTCHSFMTKEECGTQFRKIW